MSETLTERQRAIYEFIVRAVEERGLPPSLMEIAHAFDLASPAGIADHLKAIERKGYIRRRPGISRGIELRRWRLERRRVERVRRVPLVGTAPGGPLARAEEADEHVYVDGRLVDGHALAVHCAADGLENRGVLSGDILVAQPTATPGPGDLALVRVGSRVRVLELVEPSGGANPRRTGDAEVLGRVVAVLRSVDAANGGPEGDRRAAERGARIGVQATQSTGRSS